MRVTSASPPLALQRKISFWATPRSRSPAHYICTPFPRHPPLGSLRSVYLPILSPLCHSAAMAQALRTASVAASSFCSASEFVGSVERLGVQNGSRVVCRFSAGTKKVKQAAKTVQKKFSGGGANRPLWFPGAKAPEWLDGSLPGDYGFDPLALGKSPEYLQFELDSLNQNLAKNEAGDVIGSRVSKKAEINPTPFQPYSEVFGLQRFRECELIHGRWAMLAILGALSVEAFTGVTWQDAGKVSNTSQIAFLPCWSAFECGHGQCPFGSECPWLVFTTKRVWQCDIGMHWELTVNLSVSLFATSRTMAIDSVHWRDASFKADD